MAGVVKIGNPHLRLDRKIITDGGKGTTTASGALTVTFNKTFRDIRKLIVQPWGTGERWEEIDFDDLPNPTDFDLRIYDENGTQIESAFSWSAEGI